MLNKEITCYLEFRIVRPKEKPVQSIKLFLHKITFIRTNVLLYSWQFEGKEVGFLIENSYVVFRSSLHLSLFQSVLCVHVPKCFLLVQ